DCFQAYEKRILIYMEANAKKYTSFAEQITPDLAKTSEVYSRIAFAILSANSPFNDSVKALDVAVRKAGKVQASDIRLFKQVPEKAYYVNRAYLQIETKVWKPKQSKQSWNEYRLQLKEQ